MSKNLFYKSFKSPIGNINLTASEKGLCRLVFEEPIAITKTNTIIEDTIEQLIAYFQKELTVFSVQLDMSGTVFQRDVWQALTRVRFGQTATYLDIANFLNNPKAIRAVGGASGKNTVPIIVPCHRIIGQNGKMVGYSSGLWRKEWLLKHEGAILL